MALNSLSALHPLDRETDPQADPLDLRNRQTAGLPGAALHSAAFLSTMPPEKCGLATFTADLMAAIRHNAAALRCQPISLSSRRETPASAFTLRKHDRPAYRRAGRALTAAGFDLLCVQHEYGIFGGPDGEMLLDLLDATDVPVAVTLHTVLEAPSQNQRRVMDAVLARAEQVVVMTRRSADILKSVHRIGAGRLQVVPHGIPDAPPRDRAACRQAWSLGDRPTLLTFGLLSPGKGIEHAIRALPALKQRWPDVLYLVVGATHPNLVRENGESYRESLAALAAELGVTGNVRFVNRFLDLGDLTSVLTAADVYLTPYNNAAQSVSGTLSYSYGLGTPVVSTPYHHAVELLAGGRGVLVPFADAAAMAGAVGGLLVDPARRAAMRAAATRDGERMRWPNIGARYLRIFEQAVAGARLATA